MDKHKKALVTIAKLIIIVILFQTLPYKFGAKPESVELFTKLGVEPWGRILTGILELIFGLMLLSRRTVHIASIGVMAIMSGAILAHVFILGINSLFILAVITFAMAVFIYRNTGKAQNSQL